MTFVYAHKPSLWKPITRKDDPRWKQDETALNCGQCFRPFSRTIRKHHCRSCGQVVCDTCSRHRVEMEGKANSRTCGSCFNHRVVLNAGLSFKSEGFFADMNRWITENIALCAAWRKSGIRRSTLPFRTFFVAVPPTQEGKRWTRRILCINGRDRIFLTSPIREHDSTIWDLARSTRRSKSGQIIHRTIPLTITHLFHISELTRVQEDTCTDLITHKGKFSGINFYFSSWNPLRPNTTPVDLSFFVVPFPKSCYTHDQDSPCEICAGVRPGYKKSFTDRRFTKECHRETKEEIASLEDMHVKEFDTATGIVNLTNIMSKVLYDDSVVEAKESKFEEQCGRRTRRSKSDFGIPADLTPLIPSSLMEVDEAELETDEEEEKSYPTGHHFSDHKESAALGLNKNITSDTSQPSADKDNVILTEDDNRRGILSMSTISRNISVDLQAKSGTRKLHTRSLIKSENSQKISEDLVKMPFPESELLKLHASDDEQCDILQQIILKHQQNFLMRLHRFQDQCEDWEKKCSTAVSWDNPEHERMLFEVFKALRPDLESPKRQDKKLWGKLGFQGKDPVTDFRGMGILGVEFLHYLGHKKVDLANFLFRRARNEDAYYPLACSCITILSLCLELLGVKKASDIKEFHKQKRLFRVFCSADSSAESSKNPDANQLFDMVCELIIKLDTTWLTADATYMDYPDLLRVMKARLEQILEGEIFSTKELFERIRNGMDLTDFKYFTLSAS